MQEDRAVQGLTRSHPTLPVCSFGQATCLGTPQKLGVSHEHAFGQLLMEQGIGIWLQAISKLGTECRSGEWQGFLFKALGT